MQLGNDVAFWLPVRSTSKVQTKKSRLAAAFQLTQSLWLGWSSWHCGLSSVSSFFGCVASGTGGVFSSASSVFGSAHGVLGSVHCARCSAGSGRSSTGSNSSSARGSSSSGFSRRSWCSSRCWSNHWSWCRHVNFFLTASGQSNGGNYSCQNERFIHFTILKNKKKTISGNCQNLGTPGNLDQTKGLELLCPASNYSPDYKPLEKLRNRRTAKRCATALLQTEGGCSKSRRRQAQALVQAFTQRNPPGGLGTGHACRAH